MESFCGVIPRLTAVNSPPDVLVAGGLVWCSGSHGGDAAYVTEGRDIHTGVVKRQFATDVIYDVAHHHRCYREKATDQYLVIGRTGVELIGMAKGELIRNCWVRGACQYGVLPANGLLYAPPTPAAATSRAS